MQDKQCACCPGIYIPYWGLSKWKIVRIKYESTDVEYYDDT